MQIICTYKYYSYLDIQGSYVVGSMMAYPLSEYMIRGYQCYPDIHGSYAVGGVMAYPLLSEYPRITDIQRLYAVGGVMAYPLSE